MDWHPVLKLALAYWSVCAIFILMASLILP